MGKNDLPKMSPKELRKLYKSLQETWKKLLHHRAETLKHLYATDSSMKKVNTLERRVQYWLGKQRALGCPAYKPCGQGSRSGMCFVHNPQWGQNYDHLFRYKCAKCTIPPKQAKIKATWNGIFGKNVP